MLTADVYNNSGYVRTNYDHELIEDFIRVNLPLKNVDAKLVHDLMISKEIIYVETDEPRLDEIMNIVKYYQLNNVVLNLKLDSLSNYDLRYNNILKNITINHYYFGVADPPNTNSIECTLKISSNIGEYMRYSLPVNRHYFQAQALIPPTQRESRIRETYEELPVVHQINIDSSTIDFKINYDSTIIRFHVDYASPKMFPNEGFVTNGDIELLKTNSY